MLPLNEKGRPVRSRIDITSRAKVVFPEPGRPKNSMLDGHDEDTFSKLMFDSQLPSVAKAHLKAARWSATTAPTRLCTPSARKAA